jgi:DNA-binding NarL/FixJ family response regulator
MSGVYVMTPGRVAQFAAARAARSAAADVSTRQVIALMCAGLCDKQISRRTGISVQGIKHKRLRLMRSRGITSHAQLGVWARDNGWVEIQEGGL